MKPVDPCNILARLWAKVEEVLNTSSFPLSKSYTGFVKQTPVKVGSLPHNCPLENKMEPVDPCNNIARSRAKVEKVLETSLIRAKDSYTGFV